MRLDTPKKVLEQFKSNLRASYYSNLMKRLCARDRKSISQNPIKFQRFEMELSERQRKNSYEPAFSEQCKHYIELAQAAEKRHDWWTPEKTTRLIGLISTFQTPRLYKNI